jgi:GAF domain-containing protein
VFHKEEMQFLEFIAKSLGLSIQRLNRMDELRKSLEMNSWVMAATIASSRSCEETFKTILEGILTFLKADSATLELYDTHTSSLRTVKAVGGNAVVERPISFELRTIKGDSLGRIKVARSDAQNQFNAIEIETAATFSARAALALENALTHEMQRAQIHNSSPEQQKAA